MAEKLSKEKLAEYQEAFLMFDRDGDGKISPRELSSVLKKMGQHLTERELRDLIQEIDTDGSGTIEFNEFLAMMAKQQSEAQHQKEISEAFKVFDKNGDGVISAQELRQVMHSLGERLTDREIDKMIKDADQDGDGQINYNEFIRMMKLR